MAAGGDDLLTRFRGAIINITVLGLLALVGIPLIVDAFSSSYAISRIEVPASFASTTQSGDAVATALRGEVGRLLKAAQTGVAVRPDTAGASEPEIKIAGTELPLRYAAGLLREWVLRLRYVRVSGALAPAQPDEPRRCKVQGFDRPAGERPQGLFRMVLQVQDGLAGPIFDCVGDYPTLLSKASEAVLAAVDPYSAATLLAKNSDSPQSFAEARALVVAAMADARRREHPPFLQQIVPFLDSEVPRGHLALGNLYLKRGDDEAAIVEFDNANRTFAERNLRGRRWYAAEDAMSIVFLNLGSQDPKYLAIAEMLAAAAVALNPNYDAGLYHYAEAKDYQINKAMADKTASCPDRSIYDEAIQAYETLLTRFPGFAIGHVKVGVLRLQELNYLREKKHDGCSPLGAEELRTRVCGLIGRIETDFAMATNADPDGNHVPWLQWGILRAIRADLLEPGPGAIACRTAAAGGGSDRPALLSEAIARFRRANAIYPDDFFSWQQLGRALGRQRALGGEADLCGQAREAFARALALAPAGEKARVQDDLAASCL